MKSDESRRKVANRGEDGGPTVGYSCSVVVVARIRILMGTLISKSLREHGRGVRPVAVQLVVPKPLKC